MKRFLLSLVLGFLTVNMLFAQRDTDHWFAPYFDSQSTSATNYTHGLYLSTDSPVPFQVRIYNNNVLIHTETISKGDPKVYTVPSASNTATPPVPAYIRTGTVADAATIKTLGLHLKGDKPFFASLRIYNTSHGEIVTSKGKAGIGTKFYAAATPLLGVTSSSFNFTTGILATEDNTVVTISDFNPAIQFVNYPNPPASISITLNKGQSYILAGNAATPANREGFIGAKIISDKPISVTNGNSNGMYATANTSLGSDLILDQSVPTERLGNEFAMVRSLSPLNTSENMEGGIIIATEDNTQVFINGNNNPVATLNEGDFYRVLESAYVNPGGGSHYNVYIKTSKNVYLYQLIGAGVTNTGGYNYIPPLNCFLPRKIDEIGKVNEMPGNTNYPITLKLNILTEAGAVVTVNSLPLTAAQGPFPLTGNTQWVTYAVDGVTGNLTIESTKAVTAGVNGGYSSAGYGGYFAGFSSIPVIAKQTGDCVPGIILEVDDSYETYQWNLNGTPIPGATTYTYTPTQAGNYTVKVTMGTCPPVTTPIYKVFSCLTNSTQAINICATKAITPTFSNSTQTPLPSTVSIVTQPAHGTASINPTTGVITYTPNTGYLGPDTLVYTFCGNATEFIDCEQITLNLTVVPFVLTDTTIYACQYNGKGFFDLTTANVTSYSPTTKVFYPTLANLNNSTGHITNTTNHLSGAGDVYVRVTTSEGCVGTAKITLAFYPSPVVNEATLSECFIENDESRAKFNLTLANVTAQSPVTKVYYPTFTDASNGTNVIQDATNFISANGAIYIRVFNSNNCYSIAKVNLNVIPPKRSPLLKDQIICIDARTTLDAGPGYASYQWNTGATTQTLQGISVGEYWVILEDNGCFVKQTVSVKKSADPVITQIEISNNTATVIVSGGTPPYKYSVDGTTNWQDSNVFTDLSRGQHTFYVKDSYNCTPVSVEITVPNLLNAITPNGDNVNDYIDYSELSYKNNLTFVIYDRYGNKIFTGDKFNNYKWDGKHYDKKIVTGTYWYHINWNEPNAAKTPIKYTGWILVKNRE